LPDPNKLVNPDHELLVKYPLISTGRSRLLAVDHSDDNLQNSGKPVFCKLATKLVILMKDFRA